MKTSCISHPERERLVIIRKWQIEFCDGNQCAAAVMSYLEYWHNWKLDSDEYNKKSNDLSELHGDSRKLPEDVYQFHSMQEIADGILNLYGVKTIAEAIKLLELKEAISIHTNPNPNYFYDKKKYFKFYSTVCSEWIKNRYKAGLGKITECIPQKRRVDSVKLPSALGKNAALLGKNAVAITEINNKDKNQSIKADDDFFEGENKNQNLGIQNDEGRETVQLIIDALKEAGLPAKHFTYPDTVETIQRLCDAGATAEVFCSAYIIASKTSNNFGVNYLAKVVEDLLRKSKKKSGQQKQTISAFVQPTPSNESNFQYIDWVDN